MHAHVVTPLYLQTIYFWTLLVRHILQDYDNHPHKRPIPNLEFETPQTGALFCTQSLEITKEEKEMICDIFELFDTDGSGKLDFEEFYQVLEELNDSAGYPPLNEEDAWRIFTECDRDGSGRVTVLEFLKAHAPVANRPTEDASEDASSPSAADDDVAPVASPLASARGTRGGGILRDPHRAPRLEGDDLVFAI